MSLMKLFKDDGVRFRLKVIAKVTAIPFLSLLLLLAFLYTFIKTDLLFLEINRLVDISFSEIFIDFLFADLSGWLPIIFGFFCLISFLGVYLSYLLMRPFAMIANYCEARIKSSDAIYNPDSFADLRNLVNFSEFFFTKIDEQIDEFDNLRASKIPARYKGIHQPVLEKAFFLQHSLFILIITIVGLGGLYMFSVELHESIIRFAVAASESNSDVVKYLNGQKELLGEVIYFVGFIHIVLSVLLGIHLYEKVAPPAFGVFSTMRSFIKGKYSSRVHLVGYYYLRSDCRKINKYLDYISRNYVEYNKKKKIDKKMT